MIAVVSVRVFECVFEMRFSQDTVARRIEILKKIVILHSQKPKLTKDRRSNVYLKRAKFDLNWILNT